jgi:F-type H+-transporting ATPase subunit c
MATTVGSGETTTNTTTMTLELLAQATENLSNIRSWHFAVAAAAIGAAIGIGILGSKAAEATGRNPGAAADILKLAIILAALIEGIVFFAIFLAK